MPRSAKSGRLKSKSGLKTKAMSDELIADSNKLDGAAVLSGARRPYNLVTKGDHLNKRIWSTITCC